jgi:hypothetical protein
VVGDDGFALVWDMTAMGTTSGKSNQDPVLVYRGDGPINAVAWSSLQPDWVRHQHATCVGGEKY